MSHVRPVGIDLGTTYSAMAWINEQGQSELLPNAEGDLLTPTVVLFDDDGVIVGKEAKKVGVYEADRFAECAKRDMGAPFYSKTICGRKLPPEVIQAFVLKKLRNDLVGKVGESVRAVITVPAFFDEPRRKATVDAAMMAGLEVLDIVNEPTAAALAFGEHLGYLKPNGDAPQEKLYILVYDLGGGTFDVTLIELNSGNLRTLATDGDVRLGGRDWDECLSNKVAVEFEKLYGFDPRQDRVALQRLLGAAEEAKHTLTVRQSTTLKFTHGEHSHECKLTRELFEEETLHLLERTAYVTRQLLTAAGMEWKDLHRVLLVGGSTRMPMVASMLKERTGILPDHSVNPDEAVARGASLYAQYLLAQHQGEKRTTFQVTNVNSHSLGIEGVDPRTNRKCNNIIIPRNSPLPVKKTERFATKTVGQKSVVVKVLEGESPDPAECTPIGRAAIRDLPPDLPAGTKIIVTYEYGTNGRVQVKAEVVGTKKEVTLELEREGALSNDLVSQWGRMVASGGGMKSFEKLLGAPAMRPAASFKQTGAPGAKPTPASVPGPGAAGGKKVGSAPSAPVAKSGGAAVAAPTKPSPAAPSPAMPSSHSAFAGLGSPGPSQPTKVAPLHSPAATAATAAPAPSAAPVAPARVQPVTPAPIQPAAHPAPSAVAAPAAPAMPAPQESPALTPAPAIQSSGRFHQPHVDEANAAGAPATSPSAGAPQGKWWIAPVVVAGIIVIALVAYLMR